ncbi:MAG: hypothetical protein IIZ38_19760 [Sphingomonas sp.]|uniref:hypothetical protein n=1 Tax=unclassified Sphingomonas TaxID=196159 RepID=UPI00245880F1|nr:MULTISPECIES: hypothetical protein [unclassified Sphingomonas]MBQ1500549.1 hypothetical protein [Sphingomonas sp.]MDH4745600.1 hypothetical protein [Sphingomonas sp. CBMAI 2297]
MVRNLAVFALIPLALGACSRTGEIDANGGGAGVTAVRSACPHVAIPAGTGDMTIFNPATSREASAIDVNAVMTNVTSTCDDAGPQVVTTVNFDVLARRQSADGPRDVSFPYFVTVVRGGTSVVAKRINRVTVHFEPGQLRAQTSGTATTYVDRAAATLPDEVRKRLTEKRKAGEQAAAMDPLADPSIRGAVLSATFEALVGFQLTEDQLKYNVTR